MLDVHENVYYETYYLVEFEILKSMNIWLPSHMCCKRNYT